MYYISCDFDFRIEPTINLSDRDAKKRENDMLWKKRRYIFLKFNVAEEESSRYGKDDKAV
jgi:hypothetical protein